MVEFIRFMFSGFFIFVGHLIMLCLILHFLLLCWNRFWRHWNIRKHGYPPKYCDADGDGLEDND